MALNGFTRINSTNTPSKVMQAYNHPNQLLKRVKKKKKLTNSSKATFSNYDIKWLYTQTLPMPQPKSCKLLKWVKKDALTTSSKATFSNPIWPKKKLNSKLF